MTANATTQFPEYVAIIDASAETGLPYSTLRTAGHNGEFPVLKIGKPNSRRESWYVKRADLLTWLERRTQRKTQQQDDAALTPAVPMRRRVG